MDFQIFKIGLGLEVYPILANWMTDSRGKLCTIKITSIVFEKSLKLKKKKKKKGMMMENHQHQKFLPDEIIIDILYRLPADSVIRFKRVCKAWRSIIEEDPVFHYMNLDDDSTAAGTSTTMGFVVMEHVRYFFSTVHYVRFLECKRIDGQEVIRLKRWKLPVLKDKSSKTRKNLAIVGSCNGLICISNIPDCDINGSQHTTLVCNPLTAEVVNISNSYINSNTSTTNTHDDDDDDELESSSSSLSLVGIGFGYLPSTNEYKVVRMYSADRTEERRIKHVQVYTLGGGGSGSNGRWRTIVPQRNSSWSDISFCNSRWRTIVPQRSSSWSDDSFWTSARDADPIFKLGVSVNGALYFNNHMDIVSFDLAKEEFRMIVPPEPTYITRYIGDIGVLGGCLCATTYRFVMRHNSTITKTDIWVMEKEKDDQEEEESWILICTLPSEITETFLGYIPLGGALALSRPRILLQPKWKKTIISYNPETRKSCCKHIPGNWGKINVIPYMKSCVSLKALGKNTAAKKGN